MIELAKKHPNQMQFIGVRCDLMSRDIQEEGMEMTALLRRERERKRERSRKREWRWSRGHSGKWGDQERDRAPRKRRDRHGHGEMQSGVWPCGRRHSISVVFLLVSR